MMNRRNVFGALALALAMSMPAMAQMGAEQPAKPRETQAAKAKVGEAAPAFEAKDLDGKPVKLSDFKGKVVVLEWFNPGCPVVQMHYKNDTMNRSISKFEGKNVVWVRVATGNSADDEANNKARDNWHIKTPIVMDGSGAIAKAYGAKTTPHCFVIDTNGTLVYAGAVDNGNPGKVGDVNYVEKAVYQTLAGETITTAETKAYGCAVKY
ncbi:MAG: redoxin domain-containing protein [Phycisphaerales bacterium]|nr:redoxin domain-containing protein [Phycisphaerales bacterium]